VMKSFPSKKVIPGIYFLILYNNHKIYRLILNGFVVRIEKEQLDRSQCAVALKFISDPIYYSLKEISYKESPLHDEIRLLYQHYRLFRKAFEIIKKNQLF
jgi:hypothetical protein